MSKFRIRNPAIVLQFLVLAIYLLVLDVLAPQNAFWLALIAVILLSIPGILNSLNPFTKRPHAYQVVEWSITPEEIRYSCQDQKIKTTWSAFNKVVATPEGLLFLPNAEVFRFIPERAFKTSDDFEAAISLARQHAADFKELK